MRIFKPLLPIFLAISVAVSLKAHAAPADHQQRNDREEALNEVDRQALREFLQYRRAKISSDQTSKLKVSGDVRTEWRHINEKFDDIDLRKSLDTRGIPFSHNDFDIEANIRMDYRTAKTWGVAHIQYDNSAGVDDNPCCCNTRITHDETKTKKEREAELKKCSNRRFHGSGVCDDICLRRAFMGYNIWSDCDDNQRLDIELGRRRLYDVFESDIQFLSRYDGVLVKYSDKWEYISDWYIKWGGFVVDERVNQFAWASEVGFLDIYDSGFDIKYSFIDWNKWGRDRCGDRNPDAFKYRISQVLFDYHLDPDLFCLPIELYVAFLINHEANHQTKLDEEVKGHTSKHHHRDGFAWYGGVIFGKVRREGDWSLELTYQYVQRNAIPFDDQSGIGLGNIFEDVCHNPATNSRENPTVGYAGFLAEFLYALTDNLTIDTQLQIAHSIEQKIHHNFSQFEVEAIYAF